MPEHLPELFGHMGRKRRNHHDQRINRLAQDGDRLRAFDAAPRAAPPRLGAPWAVVSLNEYSSLTSSISDETAVLRCTRSSISRVTRRMVSCVLRRSARSAIGAIGAALRHAFAADRLRPVIDQAPDANEEPEAAVEPAVAPLDLFLRRRHEHHVQPQRVSPVLRQHRVGIDDVAFGLGHDGAVLQHHALREEALERLVEVDQADFPEHAREEPRIQQVQDRVLDAAAVEIDRHPVRWHLSGSNGSSALCGSQNRRKYQDESTKVSIVSVSRFAGPPQIGHLTFTNPGTCASGESPRPVNCVIFGSATGSWSYGTGTTPSFSQ